MTRTTARAAGRTVPLAPPPAPIREWLLERIARARVAHFPIRVVFPGDDRIGVGGPDSPVLRVVRPSELFRRIAADGPIGVGEGYLAGDWTSTDPAGVLTPFAALLNRPVNRLAAALRRRLDPGRPHEENNTIDGSRANIWRHYDLSNDLFAAFLDPSMTYSSAWFEPSDDLHTAQLRKIDSVLDYVGVGPGTRLLEIGSGWGSLAIRAARRGADVTTLTISNEQRGFVEERVAATGLADRIHVQLRDYREAEGRYDAIVSVEMVEAVGREHWSEYFAALGRLVLPAGRIGIQAITMPHDRLMATRNVGTWVQKYIFPGGQILSVPAIEEQVAATPSLRITARRSLGTHYARTLHEWRERFLSESLHLVSLGFDTAFQRMWEFYLAWAEAGFRSEYLNVWQFQLTSDDPRSRG